MKEPSGRRRFLKSAAALGAVIPAGAAAQTKPAPAPHADHGKTQPARAASASRPYMFLSATEVAFLDAAVSHLIPKDELGPGAKEAGVTYFIDQQLFGGYGTMAKKYTQGPWPEGTPQQGYHQPPAGAPEARGQQHDAREAQHDQQIRRQQQKGDGLRQNKKHQRFFFQSS